MTGVLPEATLTEAELARWGERVGATVEVPVFLALRGDLGAGKSVLARAIARGAGVEGPMPSPTFNLVYEYHGRRGVDVYHLDLYRLEDPEEVWELGWSEMGRGPDIVLVEWPERAEPLLPPERWELELTIPEPGATIRTVRVRAYGEPPPLPGWT